MKSIVAKALLPIAIMATGLTLLSCSHTSSHDEGAEQTSTNTPVNMNTNNDSLWQNAYVRVEPTELKDNAIDLISRQWMLVTAGNERSFNTMTASWGAMGELWHKHAAFIFIRDTRYTYEFLQREQAYTLSFFAEDYRHALNICGTRSGRATDKVKEAGLTPVATPTGMMTFAEARMIIECRTMLQQPLDLNCLTPAYRDEVMRNCYTRDTARHQLFVGEIVNVWLKK